MSLASPSQRADFPLPAPWWLFIERTPRWAPAVRTELRRRGKGDASRQVSAASKTPPLASLVAARQPVILGITTDTHSGTISKSLFSRLRAVQSLCLVACTERAPTPGEAAELYTAGAAEVFDSPLDVAGLIRLSETHAANTWRRWSADLPLAELVWRRLPWQSAPWAIG